MKHYTCDNCEAVISGGDPNVFLNGIIGSSGGILLPELFQEKHFCGPECFWQWVDKHHPGAEIDS